MDFAEAHGHADKMNRVLKEWATAVDVLAAATEARTLLARVEKEKAVLQSQCAVLRATIEADTERQKNAAAAADAAVSEALKGQQERINKAAFDAKAQIEKIKGALADELSQLKGHGVELRAEIAELESNKSDLEKARDGAFRQLEAIKKQLADLGASIR